MRLQSKQCQNIEGFYQKYEITTKIMANIEGFYQKIEDFNQNNEDLPNYLCSHWRIVDFWGYKILIHQNVRDFDQNNVDQSNLRYRPKSLHLEK